MSEAGASVSWDPVGNTEDYQSANYKLQIKQILLGHTAKADEYNVVQVRKFPLAMPYFPCTMLRLYAVNMSTMCVSQ